MPSTHTCAHAQHVIIHPPIAYMRAHLHPSPHHVHTRVHAQHVIIYPPISYMHSMSSSTVSPHHVHAQHAIIHPPPPRLHTHTQGVPSSPIPHSRPLPPPPHPTPHTHNTHIFPALPPHTHTHTYPAPSCPPPPLQAEVRFPLESLAVGVGTLRFKAWAAGSGPASSGSGSEDADVLALQLEVLPQQAPVSVSTAFALRGPGVPPLVSPGAGVGATTLAHSEGLELPDALAGWGSLDLLAGVGHLPAIVSLLDHVMDSVDRWGGGGGERGGRGLWAVPLPPSPAITLTPPPLPPTHSARPDTFLFHTVCTLAPTLPAPTAPTLPAPTAPTLPAPGPLFCPCPPPYTAGAVA